MPDSPQPDPSPPDRGTRRPPRAPDDVGDPDDRRMRDAQELDHDPLDHGTPPDPDRPSDEVWRGNTLREPGPGE
jgi:hypothetical protein